jgi:membrane associated rhomboid family serine protease
MRQKITSITVFILYVTFLVTGLLNALIFGYLNKFLGRIELKLPPDWFRALVYTFMHVNIPQISINVTDVLTASITMMLGFFVGLYVKKAFGINI